MRYIRPALNIYVKVGCIMSSNIKVTLPEYFNPDQRAYFYQSLSILNYFLLPGTNVNLIVEKEAEGETERKYNLEINFNQTIVKTSLSSNDYHSAIKKMMINLQGKFSEILETVNKREAKEKKSESSKKDEAETEKIYH